MSIASLLHLLIAFSSISIHTADSPQWEEYITDPHTALVSQARTKPVAAIHTLIRIHPNCFEVVNKSEKTNLKPFLLFAILPADIRGKILDDEFFYKDPKATQKFNKLPYARALYVLAEYQQKQKPFTILKPHLIFYPFTDKQTAAIAEIETQVLERERNNIPEPQIYAHISRQSWDIYAAPESSIIANTSLEGKLIGRSLLWPELMRITLAHMPHNIITIYQDINRFQSCLEGTFLMFNWWLYYQARLDSLLLLNIFLASSLLCTELGIRFAHQNNQVHNYTAASIAKLLIIPFIRDPLFKIEQSIIAITPWIFGPTKVFYDSMKILNNHCCRYTSWNKKT